jgi:hypothetical protein
VSPSEDDVAERARTTSERIRELVELGVIGRRPDATEPFGNGDALRVELVEELAASGVPPQSVAAAMASGDLSLSYLDKFPGPSPRSERTFGEVCDSLPYRSSCSIASTSGSACRGRSPRRRCDRTI